MAKKSPAERLNECRSEAARITEFFLMPTNEQRRALRSNSLSKDSREFLERTGGLKQ